MSLKNETRAFGDMSVTVMEFDAWRGFQLLPRLGTVLGALAPDDTGKIDMGKAIPALCESIASDPDLIMALLESTSCTLPGSQNVLEINNKDAFNVAFSGKLWTLAEVLGLVVEVSFGDFLSNALSAVGDLGGGPAEKTAETSA